MTTREQKNRVRSLREDSLVRKATAKTLALSYNAEKRHRRGNGFTAKEYAGVYADDGISGTGTEKREEFRRLLADCEAGNIDIVLCKSVSRFARNTLDLLKTVRRLKELGISVRFEKENIDTLSSDGELPPR